MALCSLSIAVGCTSGTKPEFSDIPDGDSESGLVSIAYLKSRCDGISSNINSTKSNSTSKT